MKNYAKLCLIFGIFMIAGIILFVIVSGDLGDTISVDNEKTLILNDIVKDAEEKIDSPYSFGEKDYGVDFVVLDNLGNEIYKTQGAEKEIAKMSGSGRFTIEEAGRRRLLYKYIVKDETIVGSVVLLDSAEKDYIKVKIKLILALSVMAFLFIAGAVIYGIYIDKNIIKPFNRMQSFAGKVAEGKLDEPLLMDKNNMFGVFTESFDIMREELAESKKREAMLQRKEKELIASLSHDLKTPITGIKLTTELLTAKLNQKSAETEESLSAEEKRAASDIMEKLDNIYKKAEQIDSLVSDLFSTTLEDLGEFKVSLSDEESTVLSEIVKKNDSKGLVDESRPPKLLINTDTRRMSQVIGNIISNSYKYAGTKIDVEYSIKEKYLEMMIRDYGPGVSRDELELITNKFYRGRNAETENVDGSGLGLYIAKSLMHKMNGELICESDDKGFIVSLMIPIS
ncbi:MAG: HAMP domain-containing histidine kinase [Eubacterium sp.]|nr:HAMP domain-containing histidine kinase [Eubacterium sp.]